MGRARVCGSASSVRGERDGKPHQQPVEALPRRHRTYLRRKRDLLVSRLCSIRPRCQIPPLLRVLVLVALPLVVPAQSTLGHLPAQRQVRDRGGLIMSLLDGLQKLVARPADRATPRPDLPPATTVRADCSSEVHHLIAVGKLFEHGAAGVRSAPDVHLPAVRHDPQQHRGGGRACASGSWLRSRGLDWGGWRGCRGNGSSGGQARGDRHVRGKSRGWLGLDCCGRARREGHKRGQGDGGAGAWSDSGGRCADTGWRGGKRRVEQRKHSRPKYQDNEKPGEREEAVILVPGLRSPD